MKHSVATGWEASAFTPSCLRLPPGGPRIDHVLPPPRLNQLLEPFGLSLTAPQTETLMVYLELLLRWNRRINLIGPASGEDCITRHFGESLYLRHGMLLDIGSGAGFPGLALKIVAPDLQVTLLEPTAKKRAFLKEVMRVCRFAGVTVFGERLEGFASGLQEPAFDFSTARAVGGLKGLIRSAALCLKPGGKLCLWLGCEQASEVQASGAGYQWEDLMAIPLSRERVIIVGTRSKS